MIGTHKVPAGDHNAATVDRAGVLRVHLFNLLT